MTDSDVHGLHDEELIASAIDFNSTLDLDRELEPGEKDEDAVDFADLSDHDLADDDLDSSFSHDPSGTAAVQRVDSKAADLIDGERQSDKYLDGLFEADVPLVTSREELDITNVDQMAHATTPWSQDPNSSPSSPQHLAGSSASIGLENVNARKSVTNEQSSEHRLQKELLALSSNVLYSHSSADAKPSAIQSGMLDLLWPKFSTSQRPKFMELLPPKKIASCYTRDARTKRTFSSAIPSADLANDNSHSFRLPSTNASMSSLSRRILHIMSEAKTHTRCKAPESLHDKIAVEVDNSALEAGKTHMLEAVDQLSVPLEALPNTFACGRDELMRRKPISFHALVDAAVQHQDFEQYNDSTLLTSFAPCIDLNDPVLHLLDPRIQTEHRDNTGKDAKGDISCGPERLISSGFNYDISNDLAYEKLKENHLARKRITLGSLSVQHALPATQLQWPFYKVSLDKSEARNFHRPRLVVEVQEHVSFGKSKIVKKRNLKGKSPRDLFPTSKSLAINDNSHILLLEYSEECPSVLPNLGMSSQIVNYYRRQAEEDILRPKLEFGELQILLPQDKSPMEPFGYVDAGQVLQTMQNGLYRAPVFEHEVHNTDFLVTRTTTGIEGNSWYLKNISRICAVGQEFPCSDVPGPHSRRITTAAKSRMKMLSYRLLHGSQNSSLDTADVTKHFPRTSDLQTRQKLKEFMHFDKDDKAWKMRHGTSLPSEDDSRALLRPEDICLLDATQAGQQHLRDSGIEKDEDELTEDEDNMADQSIEHQLAPWQTSRNFLLAAQGKAMLQLHGVGDPSGRGEAINMMKTSMKGGFRAVGESIADKISSRKMKDSGGHSYNVAQQQLAYDTSVRHIWNAQIRSLSSKIDLSDTSEDESHDPHDLEAIAPLDSGLPDADDEWLRHKAADTLPGHSKLLEISRMHSDAYGNKSTLREVIRNARIIRQYLKRKREEEGFAEEILEITPGNDEEENRRKRLRLIKELERLERKKEKQSAKEKVRNPKPRSSRPHEQDVHGSQSEGRSTNTTQRRCANCGQIGHIKTNKKMCPMLNGSGQKPEASGSSVSAFGQNIGPF